MRRLFALLAVLFVVLLMLAPMLGHAQEHVHPQTILLPPSQDPDKRPHFFNGVAITPEPGEDLDHASMHAIPIGNGPAADGSAWLRPDVTGVYSIDGFNEGKVKIIGFKFSPLLLRAGQIYRVLPHAGPLMWTRPDGVHEAVPNPNQIAPAPVKAADLTPKDRP